MEALKNNKSYISTCDDLEEESKKKPKHAQYLTRKEEADYQAKRKRELSREKKKALISMDPEYEETVPFADFSSDEEESNPEKPNMKGVLMSANGIPLHKPKGEEIRK